MDVFEEKESKNTVHWKWVGSCLKPQKKKNEQWGWKNEGNIQVYNCNLVNDRKT